jgi:endonuclease YncB( thermonuclease family)
MRWNGRLRFIRAICRAGLPLSLCLLPIRIHAEPAPDAEACDLSSAERQSVAEVKDGETLVLSDGRVVRLIGAKAPAAPLGWQGNRPWPMVEESKAALTAMAQGSEVELRFGGSRTDRHDRTLAQVFAVKGEELVWLQGELVGKGLARAYSFPDNHACMRALLAREDEARAAHRGIWASSAYRVVEADNVERLSRLARSFQLVEGMVASVGETKARLYLNFDQDWRKDFTVSVTQKETEAFKHDGLDLRALARQEGARARLDRVAERADDRGESRRAGRGLALRACDR